MTSFADATDVLQPNMGFNTLPRPQQVLRNASQADLVSSGNPAFHKMWITNIKIEAELKGLRYILLNNWTAKD